MGVPLAYEDFLVEFARVQGVGSKDELLTEHRERYAFQIKSRERAKELIKTLESRLNVDFGGLRVLDVGCAYGSFTIELAKRGAKVVGIDINDKWLKLADINAHNEVAAKFINCDASSCRAAEQLKDAGPFDLFIVNDVFEHVFDTVGLLETINKLSSPEALVYFKIPNGLATQHVLKEGHKKVFGISLLAPDYWSDFVHAPFQIYYRRWKYFQALFKSAGFAGIEIFNVASDANIAATQRHIKSDIEKIRKHLTRENFETERQFAFLKSACDYYFDEVAGDLDTMAWDDLFWKYRVTFWEGVLHRKEAQSERLARKPNALTRLVAGAAGIWR